VGVVDGGGENRNLRFGVRQGFSPSKRRAELFLAEICNSCNSGRTGERRGYIHRDVSPGHSRAGVCPRMSVVQFHNRRRRPAGDGMYVQVPADSPSPPRR